MATNGIQKLVQDPADATHYTYVLKFSDPVLFPSVPDTLQIRVEAKNLRSPAPASATRSINISIDATGPVIAIAKPTAGQIIGSEIPLQLTVTDAKSGVKPLSVVARVQGVNNFSEVLTAIGGDTYIGTLQTADFGRRQDITINIVAQDNAGNETPASVFVYVDDVPPWVSLDPPNMRERGPDGVCSIPFDPLGSAVGDRSVVVSIGLFRAFVWERTVEVVGATTYYYSMVDDSKVEIWIQTSPDKPILIDTGDDGECDDVNIDAGVFDRLTPLSYRGGSIPDRSANALHLDASPYVGDAYCSAGNQTFTQSKMCANSDMSYAMRHSITTADTAVVYGRGPLGAYQATALDCTGRSWTPGVPNGWTCATARATDKAGNRGIATPIKICFGNDCSAEPPPTLSCTDNCTLRDIDVNWHRCDTAIEEGKDCRDEVIVR